MAARNRYASRFAAQIAMFVFTVVLAWNLHPFVILVWILSFLVILGLLLPGELVRQRRPHRPGRRVQRMSNHGDL